MTTPTRKSLGEMNQQEICEAISFGHMHLLTTDEITAVYSWTVQLNGLVRLEMNRRVDEASKLIARFSELKGGE
jgi:alpha-tubulin suppressor-like RCC1 family protein